MATSGGAGAGSSGASGDGGVTAGNGASGASQSGGAGAAGQPATGGGSGAGAGSGQGGAGGSAAGAGSGGMGGAACPGAGQAIEFDGDARTQLDTTDAIGAVLPKGNSSRTVEMWLYTVPKSWRSEHHLYQFGSASPREGAFGIDFGDGPYPNVQVYNNGNADLTFKVPTDSVKETGWFHFAMVWDSEAKLIKGVINGTTVGSKTVNAAFTTPASRLSIGYSPTFSGNGGFTGKIDELRIWGVARTDAEIKATMNQHLSRQEPALLVYYKFDEGSGTTTKDLIGDFPANFGGNTSPKWATSDVALTCR